MCPTKPKERMLLATFLNNFGQGCHRYLAIYHPIAVNSVLAYRKSSATVNRLQSLISFMRGDGVNEPESVLKNSQFRCWGVGEPSLSLLTIAARAWPLDLELPEGDSANFNVGRHIPFVNIFPCPLLPMLRWISVYNVQIKFLLYFC